MKGLPVVPDSVSEDSVSPSFQSPAFKLHGLKSLDVIIKDLTSLKKLLIYFWNSTHQNPNHECPA